MYFDEYDKTNKVLFKQVMFYFIYSNLFPGTYKSLKNIYNVLQVVFRVCTKHKINAKNLSRFPLLIEEVAKSTPPSRFNLSVTYFHSLIIKKNNIGFVILDEKSLAFYSRYNPDYQNGQFAYIPPRIWSYLIERLDKILDDFIAHQEQLEKAFNYIANAYQYNEQVFTDPRFEYIPLSPFTMKSSLGADVEKQLIRYNASFEQFAQDYGFYGLVESYIGKNNSIDIRNFSSLFIIGSNVSFIYIIYYSIMRKSEAATLRLDCLQYDYDRLLGKIPILVGETTKTDPDSDARWVTSPNIEKAIKVATYITNLRMRFFPKNTPEEHLKNPYLFSRSYEPWNTHKHIEYSHFSINVGFHAFLKNFPLILEKEKILISKEDYRIANTMTPSLVNKEWFEIGSPWQFGYHQLRRTLAIMLKLNKVSDATIQLEMKHRTRHMQFHYTNNYGKLGFNKEAEKVVTSEYYFAMYQKLKGILDSNSNNVIFPHGKIMVPVKIVNLITENEQKKMVEMIKKGEVGCRTTLLGGCFKAQPCEYGGLESIAQCIGSNGNNPCLQLYIDSNNEHDLTKLKNWHQKNLSEIPTDSPRYNAIKQEINGIRKALTFISNHKKHKT